MAPSPDSIVAWLSTLDFKRTQSETYAQRVEGTSDWILDHPAFRSWLAGWSLSPVLWCHGLAGSGKTVSTSIVVDHLRRTVGGPRSAVAFIYCDEEAQPAQTALALLSSLCAQLAAQRATQLPPLLLKLYQQMVAVDVDRRLDIDNVMLVVMALCDDAFDRVFVCVDALDEVVLEGERAVLLQKLRWLWNRGVQIFITSQTHGDLPERCGCNKDIAVAMRDCEHILVEAVDDDIVKSVWARLRNHPDDGVKILERAGFRPARIVGKVVDDCGDMFLMAQLKMDREVRAALATLDGLPPGTWVVRDSSSSSEASLNDSSRVGSFSSSNASLWDTPGVPMRDRIIEIRDLAPDSSEASVDVQEQHNAGQEEYPDEFGDVRGRDIEVASNTSLRPVVISRRQQVIDSGSTSSQDEYGSDIITIEDRVIEDLVAGLASDIWWEGLDAIEDQDNYLRRECAMRTLSWVLHAQEPLSLLELSGALTKDMVNADLVRIWGTDCNIWVEGLERPLPPPPDLAVVGRRQGWFPENAVSITDVCEGLINIDSEGRVVVKMPWSLGPVTKARRFPNAHYRITYTCLELLCDDFEREETRFFSGSQENGATERRARPVSVLHEYTQRNWSAHLLACEKEFSAEFVVEFLCKLHESKPTWVEERHPLMRDSYHVRVTDDETPVLKAARIGLERVLKILLERYDYPIDARSYKQETAISVAVLGGHTSSVQLLLKHGASIHYRNEFGRSLLHMAAEQDDEIMVALILEMGLDKNTHCKGHDNKTALYQAVQLKKMNAVRMLLKYGCDTSKDKGLMVAAVNTGILELVELLVEHGVDLQDMGSSALFAAVRSGSQQLVEFMLRNGSTLQQLDSQQSTAFHVAASKGDLDMVKLLYEYCYDVMIPYRESDGGYSENTTAVEDALMNRDGEKDRDKMKELVEFLLARMPPGVPGSVLLGMAAAALQKGFRDVAKRLILMAPEPLQQNRKNYTRSLMGISITKDDDEFLALLLERGMSPNAKEKVGWAPLDIAAISDSVKAIALLMKHGADINVQDIHGLCPIHAAAVYDASRAAAVLLEHGADVNGKTKLGMTPVHVAAHQGALATVRVLLDHQPDLTIQAADGSTPLVVATRNLSYDVAQLLLQCNVDVSQANLDGETALHYAVTDGEISFVQTLLDRGINLSIQCRRGGTALHYASYTSKADIVNLLLQYGAEVDLRYEFDGEGNSDRCVAWSHAGPRPEHMATRPWDKIEAQWTALHSAACGGHVNVIEMLLAHGANVSAKGAEGETPLHIAASAAKPAALELLAAKGADVGMTSVEGNTALHWAARAEVATAARKDAHKDLCCCKLDKARQHEHLDHSKSDCIAALLKLGADPMVENAAGMSPLAVAVVAGHEDVVKALVAHSPPKMFTSAAYIKLLQTKQEKLSASVLQTASKAFVETDESRAAWCDVLASASIASDLAMVKLAISKGAVPVSRDATGKNPLHHATVIENVQIVDALLAAGADIKATDDQGRTALHVAASLKDPTEMGVSHGNRKKAQIVTSILQRDGVHVNERTPAGDTALHFAARTGDGVLVNALLRHGASVDIRNRQGRTPLHEAVCAWLFPQIVEMLLGQGASPSAADLQGCTPAHLMRDTKGAEQVLGLLLRHGADVLAPARCGDRPVHSAVRRNNWAVAKHLFTVGASVKDRGARSRTLLHIAARRGWADLIEPLVNMGADVEALDADGWTPMRHAKEKGRLGVVEILLKYAE
jgi:ankyrin repeat protein